MQFPPHPKGTPIVASFPAGRWLAPAVESGALSGGRPTQVTMSHPASAPSQLNRTHSHGDDQTPMLRGKGLSSQRPGLHSPAELPETGSWSLSAPDDTVEIKAFLSERAVPGAKQLGRLVSILWRGLLLAARDGMSGSLLGQQAWVKAKVPRPKKSPVSCSLPQAPGLSLSHLGVRSCPRVPRGHGLEVLTHWYPKNCSCVSRGRRALWGNELRRG